MTQITADQATRTFWKGAVADYLRTRLESSAERSTAASPIYGAVDARARALVRLEGCRQLDAEQASGGPSRHSITKEFSNAVQTRTAEGHHSSARILTEISTLDAPWAEQFWAVYTKAMKRSAATRVHLADESPWVSRSFVALSAALEVGAKLPLEARQQGLESEDTTQKMFQSCAITSSAFDFLALRTYQTQALAGDTLVSNSKTEHASLRRRVEVRASLVLARWQIGTDEIPAKQRETLHAELSEHTPTTRRTAQEIILAAVELEHGWAIDVADRFTVTKDLLRFDSPSGVALSASFVQLCALADIEASHELSVPSGPSRSL